MKQLTKTTTMPEDEWVIINRVISRAKAENDSQLMKVSMREEYRIGLMVYGNAIKNFLKQITTTK